MSRRWVRAIALMVVLAAAESRAGVIVRFVPGSEKASDRVLTKVPLKALVAEFLDPGNTGLGKSLGYLVWREIHTAISDQAGAGVILARAPGKVRLVDLLEHDYHEAAICAARGQRARMAAWGAVGEEGGRVHVSAYLSLLPETPRDALALHVETTPPIQGLQARITRTRFNFAPVETNRTELFARRLVARQGATLRAEADAKARVVRQVAAGTVLESVDMEGGWFKVKAPENRAAYIDISQVDLPPRRIEAVGRVPLHAGPGGARGTSQMPSGARDVLDMRSQQGKGLWYQVEVDGTRGWVPASVVRPRFSLPAVHFIAGLYRYQGKRFDDAKREFSQFVSASGVAEDNASLATAYQLLGASGLLSKGDVLALRYGYLDSEPFSRAIAATPYDAAPYNLRALATLMVKGSIHEALRDLERAVTLDPTDPTASLIARTLEAELYRPGARSDLRHLIEDVEQPGVRERVGRLASQAAAANR